MGSAHTKRTQAQCVFQVHTDTVHVPSTHRHSAHTKHTQAQCTYQVHTDTVHVPSAHRHSVGVLGHSAPRDLIHYIHVYSAPRIGRYMHSEPITYLHRIQAQNWWKRKQSSERSNPMANNKSVAVIGAGLVGPLQTLFLAQAGFEVHMYEKRSDFRGTSEFPLNFSLHAFLIVVCSLVSHKDQVHVCTYPAAVVKLFYDMHTGHASSSSSYSMGISP